MLRALEYLICCEKTEAIQFVQLGKERALWGNLKEAFQC